MRRSLKFLHTLGAIGMMGAMACLLVLLAWLPEPAEPAATAALRAAMGGIATWIFLPSLALTLVAGLLAMAATSAYQNAGWALIKLATGILVFEGGFGGVVGPLQEAAAPDAALSRADAATLAGTLTSARNAIWLLMAIAVVNVALGVWRPRMSRRK